MKLYKIPTINEELFSFNLIFTGRDIIPGDRHFLEHLLFKSNKAYSAESLTREITKLGGLKAFKIETTPEELLINATVLKQDMPKTITLLNSILNDALFLKEEIERERKILLQEYYNRVKEQKNIFIKAFGELFNEDLTIIGTPENIENITSSHLISLYDKFINRNNAVLFLHNGEDVPSLLNLKNGPPLNNVKEIKVKGNYEKEVKDFPFSAIILFYDEKPSLASYALKDYLNEMDAPFFRILREQKNYCYSVSASQSFAGLNHILPQFNTMCITSYKQIIKKSKELEKDLCGNKNNCLHSLKMTALHKVYNELKKNFIVDDEKIYENVLKTSALNKIKAKNDINLRFAFEYTTYVLNCTFEDLKNKPNWEEFRDFANSVRNKQIGKVLIIGKN